MPRFFVNKDQIRDDEIQILGGDVNHIKNVLRMKTGDEISISDGEGKDYFCVIKETANDEILLHIENSWHSYVEPAVDIYLFQGLPKADKMELIIQKAVELGVYEIIPVQTKRVIVKLDEKKEAKKMKRWQDIAVSAAKQSGRGRIPQVKPVMSFKEALRKGTALDGAIIPYEKAECMDDTRKIIKGMADKKSLAVYIGPEGGFDESEILEALSLGIHPVTLGKRILRTETAGLAVLSILMYEFER